MGMGRLWVVMGVNVQRKMAACCEVPGDAWILGYFTDTWSFSIQDTHTCNNKYPYSDTVCGYLHTAQAGLRVPFLGCIPAFFGL